MLALIFLIAWPVAELLVAIEVAQLIGVAATIGLLAISMPLGFWLARRQGAAAWRRLSAAITAGRPPGREVVDGALVVLGGALLIVPGFITDLIGLVLLAGPTRALARRGVIRNFRSRVVVRASRFGNGGRPYDVDSTATDIDSAQLHR
jgi:UPF0716 protein FxsA